ncbi:MAG: DUF4345 domain-containing protein [Hellea sp.]
MYYTAMPTLILKLGLYFIGIAGVIIGSMFIILGVDSTAKIFRSILSVVYMTPALTGLENVNAESELRFYSVFWIAYGAILIQTARDLKTHISRVPLLLGLFFAGGLARLAAYFTSGVPHTLFVVLMIVELVLPVILAIFWAGSKKKFTSVD